MPGGGILYTGMLQTPSGHCYWLTGIMFTLQQQHAIHHLPSLESGAVPGQSG